MWVWHWSTATVPATKPCCPHADALSSSMMTAVPLTTVLLLTTAMAMAITALVLVQAVMLVLVLVQVQVQVLVLGPRTLASLLERLDLPLRPCISMPPLRPHTPSHWSGDHPPPMVVRRSPTTWCPTPWKANGTSHGLVTHKHEPSSLALWPASLPACLYRPAQRCCTLMWLPLTNTAWAPLEAWKLTTRVSYVACVLA